MRTPSANKPAVALIDKARGPSDILYALAPVPGSTERIYIAGCFNAYDANPARGLARILADGSLDLSFATKSGFA